MDISTEPVGCVKPTRRGSIQRLVVDLPVGRKMQIGFGALTVVLGLVLGGLFVTIDRLGSANQRIVADADVRSQAAAQLRYAAADLRAAQQAGVLDGASTRTDFDQAASRFETALDALRHSSGDRVERALIQKIATGYQTFLATDGLIVAAVQAGHTELARNLTLGPESLAFGFMAEDASSFAARADAARAAAVTRFDQTS